MGHYGSWGRLLVSIIVSLAYQTRLFLAEPPPSLLFQPYSDRAFLHVTCCHMQKSHDLIPANSRITSVSFHTEESAHLTSKGSRWNKKALVEKLKFIINRLIGKQNRLFLPHHQQRCTESSGFRAFLHVTYHVVTCKNHMIWFQLIQESPQCRSTQKNQRIWQVKDQDGTRRPW